MLRLLIPLVQKKKLFLSGLVAVFLLLSGVLVTSRPVAAVTASDWQAGNIISDSVFFNSGSMNASQIQDFLNSKVPVCDTNGTQVLGNGQTRAQYSIANGYAPPYTCLKDYVQITPSVAADPGLCNAYTGGTQTSAQIISGVATACGVNPQVILVLLEKEQSLVTDTWPWSIQYQSATGYGCPDSSTSCSSTYYGFFNQVYAAARQYKLYAQNPGNYSYILGQNNSIAYNPSSSCGASTVYLQDQATAGLYNYTPYQPDAAALNNLYGSGDSCSSYGNRNFWVQFNDWFGATNDSDSTFTVTNTNPNTGANAWYLVTATGSYYIPSLDIYNAWGLNKYAFQTMSPSAFNAVPNEGILGRSLKDKYGNYFFVDNGETHYFRNSSYQSLWNVNGVTTAQSTGLVYALPGGEWAGRFLRDITTGDIWLMDYGTKHLVPPNTSMAYQWGYVPDQVTDVTSTYLATLPDGGPLTQYASVGSGAFVVDSGKVLYFNNPDVQDAYLSGQITTDLTNVATLSFFPLQQASSLVADTSNGEWYLLEGGRKHYIPTLSMAQNWGYGSTQSLTPLGDTLLSAMTDGGPISYMVQTTSPAQTWVVDGSKHTVPTAISTAWMTPSATIPTYSNQSLDLLPTGANVSTLIQPSTASFVYTLDAGTKRYLPLSNMENAWGYPTTPITSLNASLVDNITEQSQMSLVVQDAGNSNYYLLVGGTAYQINPTYADAWQLNTASVVAASTIARFTIAPQELGAYIKVNGVYYVMNNLAATPITTYADAYGVNDTNAVTLPYNPFSVTGQASYLVQSSDPNDTRMWLVNQGQKALFTSFAQEANYGYISDGTPVTTLTPSELAALPNATNSPSLLVNTPGAGVKLLSFGYALGFPDGPTLLSYVSTTNPILTLSPSIYNQFALRRTASRLIRDDYGNVYYMANGTKQHITDPGLLQTTYAGIPQTYLEGTAIVSIPSGADIN